MPHSPHPWELIQRAGDARVVRDYTALEDALDYRFRDRGLLEAALTHSSFANEPNGRSTDNTRLEFLGDAVIELAVRHHFYGLEAPLPRGTMSDHKIKLVSNDRLGTVATNVPLQSWIDFGNTKDGSKLDDNVGLRADALEAVIGAIYIDRGIEAAARVVVGLFRRHAPELLAPRV